MTVQNAEAPGGQHQQTGSREQNPDDLNRERACLAGESRRDQRDQRRRGDNPDEDDEADDQCQDGGDRARDAIGEPAVAARDQ